MTMKKTSLFILMLTVALFCQAQSITQEAARQKAMAFMQQKGMPGPVSMRRATVSKGTTSTEAIPYYIFNATDGQGFVIVAGDQRAGDILGYSMESAYDEAQLPEAAKAWLDDYAKQVELIGQGAAVAAPAKVSAHKAVDRLISSVWDQGKASETGDAFNSQCPTIEGKHCYTGCVATAMAQVMRYNKWPSSFSKDIPAYKANDDLGTVAKLKGAKFDWANMLDRYDEGQSEASCKAVAQLMRYCGQSLEMNYGIGSSSASTSRVGMALRTYFGYDVNTRYAYRSDYTIEGWDDLIYGELSEGRPVVYNGANLGGGHAFVCDGYDGNGYYHINWGWGGHCNGYYKLSILNPNGGGTGSSTASCGYSLNQGAVVGIQPPTDFDDDMRTLSLEDFFRDGHVLSAQYCNRTGLTGVFEYGFAYQEVNKEDEGYYLAKLEDTFEHLTMITVTFDLDKGNFDDGTYHFYPYNILKGSGWYRVSGDFKKYFEVTYSGGKIINITMHPRSDMQIQTFDCLGNLVVDMPQEIKLKVSNKSEEYNGFFYLFASQTNEKGEPVDKVTLPIEEYNGVSETSMYFVPDKTGKWNVWIDINEEGSNNLSPIQVDIKAAPKGKANLSLTKCDIIAGADVIFNLKVKNNASEGYYSPIYCYIFESGKQYNVAYDAKESLDIAPGATADIQFRIEGLTMGNAYYMRLQNCTSHLSSETAWLGGRNPFTVGTDLDAVGMVTASDIDEAADVYSLSGVLVRRNATTLSGLPKGIYMVKGRKHVVR